MQQNEGTEERLGGTPHRRLTRSTTEKMWAGVCGGLAEYFDVDPVLIRLIFVAATVFTGGLAIPVYLVLWMVMPRGDQMASGSPPGPRDARAWPGEFETEARRMAEGARRFGDEIAEQVRAGWKAGESMPPRSTFVSEQRQSSDPANVAPAATAEAPTGDVADGASATTYGPTVDERPDPYSSRPQPQPSWYEEREFFEQRREDQKARRQRSAGILLVGLGLLFLAQQMGVFRLIQWNLMWPAILILVGVALLFRNSGNRW